MTLIQLQNKYRDKVAIYKDDNNLYIGLVRSNGKYLKSPSIGGLRKKIELFIDNQVFNKINERSNYREILLRPRPRL